MNRTKEIVRLLQLAAEAHHVAFKKSGGVDKDWSLWYAKWLNENHNLSDVLGYEVSESQLAYTLSSLDADYMVRDQKLDWSEHYALNIEKYLEERGR